MPLREVADSERLMITPDEGGPAKLIHDRMGCAAFVLYLNHRLDKSKGKDQVVKFGYGHAGEIGKVVSVHFDGDKDVFLLTLPMAKLLSSGIMQTFQVVEHNENAAWAESFKDTAEALQRCVGFAEAETMQ